MRQLVTKPSFVYFDLDDTILDHRKAEKCALNDVKNTYADHFSASNQKEVEDIYHAGNVILWTQYSLGEITKDQLRRRRFEHLFNELSITDLDPFEIGDYYVERYTNYWDYCEGAYDGFFKIAEQYPVGILTNGFAKTQHKKLAQFAEMRDQLNACVISEEFGHMKPHPKLFAHASEQANTPPEEIVYVGDSMHSDVEGGTKAGWNVIWYAPDESEAPKEVIHAKNWAEVTDMLIL
ncbi:MAG: HAD family hydrolase [Rhodothermales bacterium]